MKKSALRKLSAYNLDINSDSNSSSSKLVKIGEAAILLGVSIDTLRRWEKKGWLKTIKTPGGTRLYDREQLKKLNPNLKRGPKVVASPFSPLSQNISNPIISTNSNIHLASDAPVLKSLTSLSHTAIEDQVESSLDLNTSFADGFLSNSSAALKGLKQGLFTLALGFVALLTLAIPAYFLTNTIKSNQNVAMILNDLQNNPVFEAKDAVRSLAGLFSPTLSHRLFGPAPDTESPPGNLAQNLSNSANPAKQRDLGYLNGQDFSRTKGDVLSHLGDVLAVSTPGSYLQINLNTEINGEASVSGNLTAPNILYTIVPGSNITVSGDPQRPTISTTGSNVATATNTTLGIASFSISNFTVSNGAVSITNGSITGSQIASNTVENSNLASSSITINTGSGLTGGGAVSLGGSITISSSGSSGAVTSVTGTANQITASPTTGDVVLSLPQDIALTSSPTFAGLNLTGSTSGNLLLNANAVTTDYTFTFPADDGTAGYVLSTDGNGNTSWVAGGSSTIKWNALDDPDGNQTLDMSTYTTTWSSAITSGTFFTINANSLTDGAGANISSTSTDGAGSGASYLLNLTRSGTNSNASHTAYGLSSNISNTGTTSTNIAGYFNASGASTNYGIYVAAGSVNIQGLTASSAVYTDSNKNLTSTAPTSGTIGYWSRTGTTLSPATSGDAVTTSGNISTTGTGTITSAGLLTATGSLTVGTTTTLNGITYTWPGSQGSGYVLTTNGSGTLSWTDPGSVASRWDIIASPAGNQTLAMANYTTTWNWATASTQTGLTATANALTTGKLFSLSSTSTAGDASGATYLLDLARSGTNANSDHSAYGIRSQVTNTGTGSINTAAYLSASGGDTNYALYIAAGSVNIQGLTASAGVYTDSNKNLTSTPPSSGTIGYWSRTGTTLSPSNSGDNVITAGTITSGSASNTGIQLDGNGGAGPVVHWTDLTGPSDYLTIGATGGTNNINTLTRNFRIYSTAATEGFNFLQANGYVGIGDSSPSSLLEVGDGTDSLQVSSVGDLTFVDANGAASITGPAGGALNINGGSGQSIVNTSSATIGTTTSSAFVFNASSITSGTALYLTSSATSGKTVDINATQTSGTIFNLAYGASTSLAGSLTGLYVDLNSGNVDATNQNLTGVNFKIPTVTDTHTSGTKSLTGMLVNFGSGAGINQNGAGGTLEYIAGDFYMPALTQTAGTLNAYGTRVTTPATITTGGNAYGNYISAAGVGAGTLSGVGISGITGGAGTEYAINVGTGWDAVLRVGSTTVINGSGVTTAVGGGTGQSSYATGDILYADSSTTLTKLNATSNGYVLTLASGVPSWAPVSGTGCTNCVINDPSSSAQNTIAPTGDNTTGLSVRQTSTSLGANTPDIFNITSADGLTKYFYVDYLGNVSSGSSSFDTLTLTPQTNTTALTLVGTNVTSAVNQYINTKNSSAASGILNLSYGAAQSLGGTVIGFVEDLSTNVTATNQSVTGQAITLPAATNTSGTQNYKGLVVTGGALNENGGTATNFMGVDITIPALTETSGTLTAYGTRITTPSSITTGGTAYGTQINASGIGAGTLNGINITAITAGAGTEYALNIGDGWDYGARIDAATTQTLWVSGNTNSTTAAGGIAFGSSKDTTLYRSAAGTLAVGTATSGGDILALAPQTSTTTNAFTGTITSADLTAARTYTLPDATGTICVSGTTCASSGIVGYWSRTGTVLSPATANDTVSVANTTTTGADLAITNTGVYTGTGIFNLTANSATTGTLASISGTGFTTGKALSVSGTWTPTDGSTNNGVSLTFTHASTTTADAFRGITSSITDSTTVANATSIAGLFFNNGSVNAAKSLYGLQATAQSSSTTADTLVGGLFSTSATGVLSSGSRAIRGVQSSPASTAASTGGTLNAFGGYFTPSSTLSGANAGSDTVTNNVYGLYTAPVLTIASDCTGCTSNQYGLYVDNGTSSTNGASTKYGIYINTQSGADTNYALYSAATANSYFAGSLGVGTLPTSAARLRVAKTFTSSSSSFDQNSNIAANITSVSGAGLSFLNSYNYISVNLSGTDAVSGIRGVDSQVAFSSALSSQATVGLTNMYSYTAFNNVEGASPTGTITNAIDYYAGSIQNTATGTPAVTITSKYGIQVANQGSGSGSNGLTINSATGISIADTTTATNNTNLLIGTTTIPSGTFSIYNSSTGSNYLAGNTGIGTDSSPDATLEIENAITTGQDFLITNSGTYTGTGIASIIANSTTTGNIFNMSATGMTTGELFNIDSTYAPSDGSTNEAIDINITHTPTSSADNFQSINLATSDGTALNNVFYGIFNDVTVSGNAAKQPFAYYGRISSSSTTGDTLKTAFFTTSATGALSSGTRSIYGVQSNPASTAASTGGTLNIYGGYFNPTSTLSNPGGSDTVNNNVYGIYTSPTLTLAADCGASCTSNQYGVYIDNGTSSTNGTSTKYGLYVVTPTGADTNYAAYFAGGKENRQSLSASSAVYTDSNKNLTSTAPTSGTIGYWSRTGTVLSPATANDTVSVANTTTTGADIAITNTGVYTGTGIFNLTANSATTGTLAAITGNGLTSGTGLAIASSSTAVTTGSLLTTSYTGTAAFTGNLNSFSYAPGSTPSSVPTGDLLRLSLGANATNFTGNFLNLVDNTSSVFSVSKTAFTTSLPSNFTSPGNISAAYNINFTNPTSSAITSVAPLSITAGEVFNSSNLTLQTYNQGTIVLNTANTTTTAVDLTNSTLTTGIGFNIALTGSSQTSGSALTITQSGTTTGFTGNLVNITGSSTTGTGNMLNITSVATTNGNALNITANALTTGEGLNVNSTGTIANGGNLVQLTANSATTGDILNISATGLSTGQAIDITGPSATGVTGNFINVAGDVGSGGSLMNLSPDFSGSAVTSYGLRIQGTDATSNANTSQAVSSSLVLTGNAAKVGYGVAGTITSNSTTGDTLTGGYFTVSHTGNNGSGTRTMTGVSGIVDNSTSDSVAAALYGGVFQATGNTGGSNSQSIGVYAYAASSDINYSIYAPAGDAYFVDDIGLGISPQGSYDLDINQTCGTTGCGIYMRGSGTYNWNQYAAVDSNLYFVADSGNYCVMSYLGSAVACTSDRTLKHDINQIDGDTAMDVINKLKPSTFYFNAGGGIQAGFIAQEVMEILPEAVTLGVNGKYALNQSYIIPYTVKALQELDQKVNNLSSGNGFTIDSNGYIVMTNVKMDKILVNSDAQFNGQVSANRFSIDASSLNRSGTLASIPVNSQNKVSVADAINLLNLQTTQNTNTLSNVQSQQASQSAQLAQAQVLGQQAVAQAQSLDQKVASTSANLASLSDRISELLAGLSDSSESTGSAIPQEEVPGLTPPSVLSATDSATLADLNVTDKLSSADTSTLDLTVSDTFKALGNSFLGNTTIAGDLSVDGTFSVTDGKAINAFPTLFLQNNPLAQAIDIFNGKVVITKNGQIAADSLALGNESLGEATIAAGQTEITIPTTLVKTNSKVFITPTSAVSGNLFAGQIVDGSSFKIKLSTPNLANVKFNWMIIQSKEAQN